MKNIRHSAAGEGLVMSGLQIHPKRITVTFPEAIGQASAAAKSISAGTLAQLAEKDFKTLCFPELCVGSSVDRGLYWRLSRFQAIRFFNMSCLAGRFPQTYFVEEN